MHCWRSSTGISCPRPLRRTRPSAFFAAPAALPLPPRPFPYAEAPAPTAGCAYDLPCSVHAQPDGVGPPSGYRQYRLVSTLSPAPATDLFPDNTDLAPPRTIRLFPPLRRTSLPLTTVQDYDHSGALAYLLLLTDAANDTGSVPKCLLPLPNWAPGDSRAVTASSGPPLSAPESNVPYNLLSAHRLVF